MHYNHSYNQPQPKHQIISQTTGPLIIQQKKQSEPYFYDPQRPIAKRAFSNKSSILNNPVLDQTEKNRLITNDQIYAIQKEAQQLENEQYNYDTTNNLPCSPEPPDSETETDNENDNMPSDYDNDNEYNHNPHQRHPSQQNIPNYQRYNNNHSSSHYPRNQSHNNHHSHTYHNNNTYNEYNHSRHHRYHNRYNRHNHYSPNHYQNNNNYRNNMSDKI